MRCCLPGRRSFRVLGARRPTSGAALLREIRESFYRKLFLAFVAASIIPVLTLALVTRAYIADQLRRDVEAAAQNTTAIARRVIEELSALRGQADVLSTLDDDVMVGSSRVIDQDVNIFGGPRLVATSERDLFASGLLPTRTPADVYRAIVLERLPTVRRRGAGRATSATWSRPRRCAPAGADAMLTVPLALRQREIEREIDDLDPAVVLAALLFILVGAALGYSMAERIADPVSRLTRATRRHRRAATSTRASRPRASDELRRLVDAFNAMAASCSGSASSSSARIGSRPGPRWRARWRTRSRTR